MKKLFTLALLAGILACFTACDKDKDGDVTAGTTGYLTIDGKSYKITDVGLGIDHSLTDTKYYTDIFLWATTGDFNLEFDDEGYFEVVGDYEKDSGHFCLIYITVFDGWLDNLPAGIYTDTSEGCYVEYFPFDNTSLDSDGFLTDKLEVECSGNNYTIRFEGTTNDGKHLTFNWSGAPKYWRSTDSED